MNIQTAMQKIREAQQLNVEAQRKTDFGSPEWRRCESIDDRLHEALMALCQ